MTAETITYAFLGGMLPALVWLAFWLREDYKHPEPRGLILRTFLFGMGAVVLVLPFQKIVDASFPGTVGLAVLLWAVLEECFKFGAAYIGGLKSVEDNEPVDPIIYMITAALGFAALENALFIFGPLADQNILGGIMTGNLRFIGATLLHVVSSSTIGISLAFSFYSARGVRIFVASLGLLAAIAFHTAFNLSLLNGAQALPLLVVWLGVVALLLAFEKVKTIAR